MSEWCQKCGTYHDITTAGGCPYKEDKLWVGTYAEGFRAGQESAERRTEAPEAEYREERAQRQLAEARCVALEAENGRLQEALHEAATSLETISKLAGRDEMLEDMMQIRGYANSRARVAFAGLDAAPHLGAAAMSPELLGQQPPAPEPQSEVKPHPCGHM